MRRLLKQLGTEREALRLLLIANLLLVTGSSTASGPPIPLGGYTVDPNSIVLTNPGTIVPADSTSDPTVSDGMFQRQIKVDGTPTVPCSTSYGLVFISLIQNNQIGEPIDRVEPYAYIPNTLDGTVSVIGTDTFNTYATIPVQASPYGIAVEPRGLRAYVGNRASNSVSVIDADTLAVTGTIATGTNPAGLALIDAGGGQTSKPQ